MKPFLPSLAVSGLALMSVLPLGAQSLSQVASSAEADLKVAVSELSTLNEQIAAEKIPLSKQLGELDDAVGKKRREAERAQRLQDNKNVDLDLLRVRVRARTAETDYLASLLTEYTRAFESRIHISEAQVYKSVIEESKAATDDVNLSQAEKFSHQIKVVQAALNRLDEVIGGTAFEGQALAPNGNLERGKFAVFGPIAVFSSSASGATGLADIQIGSAEPSVIEIDPELMPGIKSILDSGSGKLPVDVTMGNALKIAATRETWLEHVKKGGPVMIPLLSLAGLAALIGILKWVQLTGVRKARVADLDQILDHLRQGDKAKAMEVARSIRGPAGDMLSTAVDHSGESKELIEEVLYERMLNNKPKLERLMPFIALTAATAPLLGLLGTVTGMINTFKMITVFGTGDPKLLSAGISEALITTEYGLIIAVPCLLLHALLNRKAKGVISSMEQTAVGFINGLPNPK